MTKKTTITLRDDVCQKLEKKQEPGGLSSQINKILVEYFTNKESMFGTMKQTDTSDLRDHKDHCL